MVVLSVKSIKTVLILSYEILESQQPDREAGRVLMTTSDSE